MQIVGALDLLLPVVGLVYKVTMSKNNAIPLSVVYANIAIRSQK